MSGAGKLWPKVKAMALRGWVRCRDGRAYHPLIAERVMVAWEARLAGCYCSVPLLQQLLQL